MKCENCQHILPDDSEFCQYCGKKIDKDEKKTGTMGLDENNPVIAGGIEAEKEYISKLCTADGRKINWIRKGSRYVSSVDAMIDIYIGTDEQNNEYGPIYINMYGNTTATIPVEGYALSSNITSTYDPTSKIITNLITESLKRASEKTTGTTGNDETTSKKTEKNKAKQKHCVKCGGIIDNKTKKCTQCGKSAFPLKPILIASLSVIATIIIALASIFFIIPEIKYNHAVSLANDGNYDESNKIFNEIIDYKNSKQLIHTHNFNETIEEVKPLCEKDGYVVKKCDCGKTNKEIIKMTGHNYLQTVKKVDATCEKDGSIIKKCVCGKTKEEVIHKLGHSYTSPTCTEPGKCSRCGKTGESPLGHMTGYAVCPACGEVLFEKQTYSGYGTKAITGINLPEGEYNIISTFSGEYNFIVTFENELIANQVGSSNIAYKYSTPLYGLKNGILNVEMADGNWSITIEAVN